MADNERQILLGVISELCDVVEQLIQLAPPDQRQDLSSFVLTHAATMHDRVRHETDPLH
jgi:hypothetical protein